MHYQIKHLSLRLIDPYLISSDISRYISQHKSQYCCSPSLTVVMPCFKLQHFSVFVFFVSAAYSLEIIKRTPSFYIDWENDRLDTNSLLQLQLIDTAHHACSQGLLCERGGGGGWRGHNYGVLIFSHLQNSKVNSFPHHSNSKNVTLQICEGRQELAVRGRRFSLLPNST